MAGGQIAALTPQTIAQASETIRTGLVQFGGYTVNKTKLLCLSGFAMMSAAAPAQDLKSTLDEAFAAIEPKVIEWRPSIQSLTAIQCPGRRLDCRGADPGWLRVGLFASQRPLMPAFRTV